MLLTLENFTVKYNSLVAVDSVYLEVRTGEIVSLIGPNGAGKSTILKAIFGLIKVNDGKIIIEGEIIKRIQPDLMVSKGVSLIHQKRHVFDNMTVRENLRLACLNENGDKLNNRLHNVYELFPKLKDMRSKKVGLMSTGEQQMVAIGRAIMQKPKIILADEPLSGLSQENIESISKKIRKLANAGIGVLMVEQNIELALNMSARAYVIRYGKIDQEGPAKTIASGINIKKMQLQHENDLLEWLMNRDEK